MNTPEQNIIKVLLDNSHDMVHMQQGVFRTLCLEHPKVVESVLVKKGYLNQYDVKPPFVEEKKSNDSLSFLRDEPYLVQYIRAIIKNTNRIHGIKFVRNLSKMFGEDGTLGLKDAKEFVDSLYEVGYGVDCPRPYTGLYTADKIQEMMAIFG